MDDLTFARRMIESVDDARHYLAKCREMEDEDIPDDFVETAFLAAMRGEPLWQSGEETATEMPPWFVVRHCCEAGAMAYPRRCVWHLAHDQNDGP